MTSDQVGSVEPLDPWLPELAGDPSPGPKRSVFREFPWRWSDVLIGLAPDICFGAAAAIINPKWLWVGPRWLWLPFAVTLMAWMLLYRLWIVRRRARLLSAACSTTRCGGDSTSPSPPPCRRLSLA
jgi:hypothetical protein